MEIIFSNRLDGLQMIFQDLCLRQNLLTKIESLQMMVTLTSLDLYDNQITKIEGLETLINLE